MPTEDKSLIIILVKKAVSVGKVILKLIQIDADIFMET